MLLFDGESVHLWDEGLAESAPLPAPGPGVTGLH